MKVKFYSSVLVIAFAIQSCSNNTQTGEQKKAEGLVQNLVNKVISPLKDYQAPVHRRKMQSAEGDVYRTEKGSVVIVPPNAFVTEEGKIYQGEVSIETKEIFGAAAIVLSGIPMNVKDKDGQVKPFISDGMFDISASGQGKPLKIADGKTISVATPSEKTSPDFDLWKLDETTQEWQNLGDREKVCDEKEVLTEARKLNPDLADQLLSKSPKVAEAESAMSGKLPGKPQEPMDAEQAPFLFNLRADYKDYPELESFKNVMWTAANGVSKQEQDVFLAEVAKPGANLQLSLKDENAMIYQLNYGEKSIDLKPALSGSDLKAAKEEFAKKMKTYKQELANAEKVRAALAKVRQADEHAQKVYTMFRLVSTGMYNCDRYYNSSLALSGFSLNAGNELLLDRVYAILNNNQGTISLSAAYLKDGEFMLPSKDVKGFIQIREDGTAYKVKNDQKNDDKSIHLDLMPHEVKIKNEDDLKSLIYTL